MSCWIMNMFRKHIWGFNMKNFKYNRPTNSALKTPGAEFLDFEKGQTVIVRR